MARRLQPLGEHIVQVVGNLRDLLPAFEAIEQIGVDGAGAEAGAQQVICGVYSRVAGRSRGGCSVVAQPRR